VIAAHDRRFLALLGSVGNRLGAGVAAPRFEPCSPYFSEGKCGEAEPACSGSTPR